MDSSCIRSEEKLNGANRSLIDPCDVGAHSSRLRRNERSQAIPFVATNLRRERTNRRMRRGLEGRKVQNATDRNIAILVAFNRSVAQTADHRGELLLAPQAAFREKSRQIVRRCERRYPKAHTAPVSLVAPQESVQSTTRRRRRQANEDRGVSPRRAGVHHPGHVFIDMNFCGRRYRLGARQLTIKLLTLKCTSGLILLIDERLLRFAWRRTRSASLRDLH